MIDVYLAKFVYGIFTPLARLALLLAPRTPGVRRRLGVPIEGGRAVDVFRPRAGAGPFPVVLYVHGGGWVAGSRAEARGFCERLAAAGYLVVSADYPLAPRRRHPAQLLGVDAALAWIGEHARAFGGDPARVFIAGESAGAHLALLYALSYRDPSLARAFGYRSTVEPAAIKGLLLYCGAYDLATAAETGFPGLRLCVKGLLGSARAAHRPAALPHSPLGLVGHDCPPALVASGAVDALHPESLALVRRFEAKGVPHRALLFGERERLAFHSFHFLPFGGPSEAAFEATKDFIKANS